MIHRVASSKTNILILGESGTGKELTARMIHDEGPLKSNPFIPVNCGAIPENLIETEMFGHHKGSFTGAVADKVGLFEAANRGTLFLDEIGELPLHMQVKLLRALQERVIRKVGGVQDIPIDVRIITATNRNLEDEVKKGRFREDLYYRLNVISIRTPPLRARHGDIKLLALHFLKAFAKKAGKSLAEFDPETLQALEAYSWPGNVRELENSIERAVTMEGGATLSLESLPVDIRSARPGSSDKTSSLGLELPVDLDLVLIGLEKEYLRTAVQKAGGVNDRAGKFLGISLKSLKSRMKKLGI
jgi:two-component system response regulator PilR (NtrC family)